MENMTEEHKKNVLDLFVEGARKGIHYWHHQFVTQCNYGICHYSNFWT